MLKLKDMTQQDAQHTLRVYQWIVQNLPEISALAEDSTRSGVSANEMQETFHTEYTELSSTRFLPVHVVMFTDEDTLNSSKKTEPTVILYQPLAQHRYVIADYFHTLKLQEVTERFGISGDDPTWKASH